MTDNEIIKALECCSNGENNDCVSCVLHSEFSSNCIRTLTKNAVDLINRQKEELKWLREEKLKELTDSVVLGRIVHTQEYVWKREAIKEFAEKVLRRFAENCSRDHYKRIYNTLLEVIKETTEYDG